MRAWGVERELLLGSPRHLVGFEVGHLQMVRDFGLSRYM
jgi:hypothetical protein